MKYTQNGNVLFYILIATALIGALSYAIANSTRGNSDQLTAERARLLASEIIEYAGTMEAGVTQLSLLPLYLHIQ